MSELELYATTFEAAGSPELIQQESYRAAYERAESVKAPLIAILDDQIITHFPTEQRLRNAGFTSIRQFRNPIEFLRWLSSEEGTAPALI